MHKTLRTCYLTLMLLLSSEVPVLSDQDKADPIELPAPTAEQHSNLSAKVPGPAAPTGGACAPDNNCMGAIGAAGNCRDRFKDGLQSCFIGYASEFAAPPLGGAMGRQFLTQVRNANPHRLMLYDFDFVCGTAQLNCRGLQRLARIASMLAEGAPAVLIEEKSCCTGLNEARRLCVYNTLLGNGVPAPEARVAIASPQRLPLLGMEAALIYANILRQTQSAGTLPGTAVISGGFSPGGFTGGGTFGAFSGGGLTPGGAAVPGVGAGGFGTLR